MIGFLKTGAIIGVIALSAYAVVQTRANASLRAENAAQARSIATITLARDKAREAQAVATAYASREASRAAEYDNFRETLLRGNEDEPLPEWFRAYMRDLLNPSGL